MADLFHFAATAKGLEIREKIKLILFAAGAKPNTHIVLKISPENLDEKYEFERLLQESGTIFKASRAKSYEEISGIDGGKIKWELKGVWRSYDLFKDKNSEQDFKRYIDRLIRFKHNKADKLAGKIYGYPSCCVRQFIKEHDPEYLARKYSYYEYYKKLHDVERKFPWVFHKAHAADCEATARLNKIYERTVKEQKEKVWQEYHEKKIHKTELIVSGRSDILVKGQSIWPEKEGYEYELITKKPFRGKYYLISYLTKKLYAPGQILEGEVIFRHHYAEVAVTKEKKKVTEGLHHERHLPLLGRKF